MKAIEKAKKWIKENETKLLVGAYAGCCGAFGYLVGCKVSGIKTSIGLMRFHERGFIKFFDPQKAVEVGVEEVCSLIEEAKF